jgi:hypothetical protein
MLRRLTAAGDGQQQLVGRHSQKATVARLVVRVDRGEPVASQVDLVERALGLCLVSREDG